MSLTRRSQTCLLFLLAAAGLSQAALGSLPTASTGTTSNVVTEQTRLKDLRPMIVQSLLENPFRFDVRMFLMAQRTPYNDRLPGSGKARGRTVFDTLCFDLDNAQMNLRRVRPRFDADAGAAVATVRVPGTRDCFSFFSVTEFTGNQAQPVGSTVSTTLNVQHLPPDVDDSCFDAEALCLNAGRFRVQASWRSGNGFGDGVALAQADNQGLFYFLDPDDSELVVKVLNGCEINGFYWVFYSAATRIGFELSVEDTLTDTQKIYTNPDINPADTITDTQAFATCP